MINFKILSLDKLDDQIHAPTLHRSKYNMVQSPKQEVLKVGLLNYRCLKLVLHYPKEDKVGSFLNPKERRFGISFNKIEISIVGFQEYEQSQG